MSQSPPFPEPEPTPQQREGCLLMLVMMGIGILLLLPGVCTIIVAIIDTSAIVRDPLPFAIYMALAAGGVALIWNAAFRRR